MTDFKINQTDWDAASPEEQKQILEGLVKAGTLKSGDRIIGDPGVPSAASRTGERWNPIKDLCEAACSTAAAAGAAWCSANTVGLATVACIAAAEAAREACKSRC